MYEPLISALKKSGPDVDSQYDRFVKRVPFPLISAMTIKEGNIKIASSHYELFPIGLNHFCKTDFGLLPTAFKKFFKTHYPDYSIKRVLLLVTTQEFNPYYYEHVSTLVQLFKKSGYKVDLGTLEEISAPITIKTPSKISLKISPTQVKKNKLVTTSLEPDFIYFTTKGFSMDLLAKLSHIEQPMNPPLKLFSHREKKSDYLFLLNRFATEFSQITNTDPWLFKTEFWVEPHVNVDEKNGIEKVAISAQNLLNTLGMKFKEYQVTQEPSVRLSNNSGTYGMGILSIHSFKDLAALYQRKKAKMTGSRSQAVINDVLIQEEIPSVPLFEKCNGEIVIYSIGAEMVGGYLQNYIAFAEKSLTRQHLFMPVCFSSKPHGHTQKRYNRNKNLIYGHLSRIGNLALGYTMDKIPS